MRFFYAGEFNFFSFYASQSLKCANKPPFWAAALMRRELLCQWQSSSRGAAVPTPSMSITNRWSDQRERNPKEKTPSFDGVFLLVDLKGIEPSTLRMRTVRAPSCATGPYLAYLLYQISVDCKGDFSILSRRLQSGASETARYRSSISSCVTVAMPRSARAALARSTSPTRKII